MDLDTFYQAMVLISLRMTRRARAATTSPLANPKLLRQITASWRTRFL